MTSIRSDLTTTPQEDTYDVRQGRQAVRLSVVPAPRRESDPLPRGPRHARKRRRFPVTGDDWLRLAERAFGDLASTLREALLTVCALAVVLTAIGIAFGFLAAVVGAVACVVVYLVARGSSLTH